MATYFVTGGSGFIGGRLIRRLVADGHAVNALARSDPSANAVEAAGAVPARGDITDADSMRTGAAGCDIAVHAAAALGEWGDPEYFEEVNVRGTQRALAATRDAGVTRFVHVGTEAALMAGQPLVNADETLPLRPDSPVLYCATKAKAEQAVRDANAEGFATVVVRPRLVWGPGDTTILPSIRSEVEKGRFAWIGGGGHRTSTSHVDNVVEGLLLAAERGRPGGVYFVLDDGPVVFRDFITRLLATQGLEAPTRTLPTWLARTVAAVGEGLFKRLHRENPPPLTRIALWLSSLETTLDDSRAREELGYRPVKSIDDGLAELSAAPS
ncbi:MAG: NAD-dependent epimerase/dehydratase family protein [Thermoleophilaceae bacterium]|nr:NAD-dependent epimerase/dehydratase family protein [Thermoleophilaceae bacterium]